MSSALVNIFTTIVVEKSDAFKGRIRVFSYYFFTGANFG